MASFLIEAKNNNGQRIFAGRDEFQIKIKGIEIDCQEVVDKGDGTYEAKYVPLTAGKYTIDVLLGSRRLQDSPWSAVAKPGAVAPTRTEFKVLDSHGDALENLFIKEKFCIEIAPRDRYGNRTLADENFTASVHWIDNCDDDCVQTVVRGQVRRLEREMEAGSRRISKGAIEREVWARSGRGSPASRLLLARLEQQKSRELALAALPSLVLENVDRDQLDEDLYDCRAEAKLSTSSFPAGLATNDLYDRSDPTLGGWDLVGSNGRVTASIHQEFSAREYEPDVSFPEREICAVYDVEEEGEKGKILPLSLDFHGLLSGAAANTDLLKSLQVGFGRSVAVKEANAEGELSRPSTANIHLESSRKIGMAVLSIKYKGQNLVGSPFPMSLVPSRVSLSSSKVFSVPKGDLLWSDGGPLYKGNVQAVAGTKASFNLYLCDCIGNFIESKVDVYAYLLSDTDKQFRKDAVIKQHGASHTITVEVALAGHAVLCIALEEGEERISLPIIVKASKAEPAMCIARGDGFTPSPLQWGLPFWWSAGNLEELKTAASSKAEELEVDPIQIIRTPTNEAAVFPAGTLKQFELIVSDRFGNPTSLFENIIVNLQALGDDRNANSDEDKHFTNVTMVHEGIYDVSYATSLPGCYRLSLELDGTSIPGTPFYFTARAPAKVEKIPFLVFEERMVNVNVASVNTEGIHQIEAGQSLNAFLYFSDANGEHVDASGEDGVEVELFNPAWTYGAHAMRTSIASGSDEQTLDRDRTGLCKATFDANAQPGQKSWKVLFSSQSAGNYIAKVKIRGEVAIAFAVNVVPSSKGAKRYKFSTFGGGAGVYIFAFDLFGNRLRDSDPSPLRARVQVEEWSPADTRSSQKLLQLNRGIFKSQRFVAGVIGGTGGDGLRNHEFQFPEIIWRGSHMCFKFSHTIVETRRPTKMRIMVRSNELLYHHAWALRYHLQCDSVSLHSVNGSALFAGESAAFEISAGGQELNQIVHGFLSEGKISLTYCWEEGGPIEVAKSAFALDEKGVVVCSLPIETTGSYTMWISSNSMRLTTAPIFFAVGSGAVCNARCSLIGQGLTRAYVGRKASFTIIARDRIGNRLHRGGLLFHANIRKASAIGTEDGANVEISVKDCSDGAYSCEFVPAEKGEHVITISLDGDHITAPRKLVVLPPIVNLDTAELCDVSSASDLNSIQVGVEKKVAIAFDIRSEDLESLRGKTRVMQELFRCARYFEMYIDESNVSSQRFEGSVTHNIESARLFAPSIATPGRLECTFKIKKTGTHLVSIYRKFPSGQRSLLKGGRFVITGRPGPLCPIKCTVGSQISLGADANGPAPPGGRTLEVEAGQIFSFNTEIRDEFGNLTDIDEACTLYIGASIPSLLDTVLGDSHSMCHAKRISRGIFRCRFGVTRSGLFQVLAEVRPSLSDAGSRTELREEILSHCHVKLPVAPQMTRIIVRASVPDVVGFKANSAMFMSGQVLVCEHMYTCTVVAADQWGNRTWSNDLVRGALKASLAVPGREDAFKPPVIDKRSDGTFAVSFQLAREDVTRALSEIECKSKITLPLHLSIYNSESKEEILGSPFSLHVNPSADLVDASFEAIDGNDGEILFSLRTQGISGFEGLDERLLFEMSCGRVSAALMQEHVGGYGGSAKARIAGRNMQKSKRSQPYYDEVPLFKSKATESDKWHSFLPVKVLRGTQDEAHSTFISVAYQGRFLRFTGGESCWAPLNDTDNGGDTEEEEDTEEEGKEDKEAFDPEGIQFDIGESKGPLTVAVISSPPASTNVEIRGNFQEDTVWLTPKVMVDGEKSIIVFSDTGAAKSPGADEGATVVAIVAKVRPGGSSLKAFFFAEERVQERLCEIELPAKEIVAASKLSGGEETEWEVCRVDLRSGVLSVSDRINSF